MKLLGAVLTLLLALMIEAVAGYFSVVGLTALFAAAFWPVVVMGATLETGKLVAATWLKANLGNSNVSMLHKLYLLAATLVLMTITSLGIYGYLAKAHLEQEANLPAIEIQIKQMESRIQQATDERLRQESRLTQLDQSVSALLANAKTAKEAQAANRSRDLQKRERLEVQKQITGLNKEVNTLNDELAPLRLKIADVSAKLGPLKYVAKLFGWEDPSSAVQLIILLIMFAFDPLAVVMVLSGTLTLNEYAKESGPRRAERRARKAQEKRDAADAKARLDAINLALKEKAKPAPVQEPEVPTGPIPVILFNEPAPIVQAEPEPETVQDFHAVILPAVPADMVEEKLTSSPDGVTITDITSVAVARPNK